MASFRQLASGNWQATVSGGIGADGKQIRATVTMPTKKECRSAANELQVEMDNKKLTNVPNMKLSAWITQWMEINQGGLSPSTFSLYRTYEKIHWSEIGNYKMSQLSEPIINKFMNDKLKTLSRASVRRMMSALKVILRDAMKQRSPARDIKLPIAETSRPYVLTEIEMQQIHEFFRGSDDEPIILLAGWCGLRRGEIFALKWNDIDWDENSIRIDESMCIDEDCQYAEKRPKSENGMRDVLVPEYLIEILREIKKDRTERAEESAAEKTPKKKKITINIENDLIFSIRPDSFSSHFAKAIRENNLPPVCFHELRHYHASWLYAENIPNRRAAELLGHDVQTLLDIYQHLALDRKATINDQIKALYAKKK